MKKALFAALLFAGVFSAAHAGNNDDGCRGNCGSNGGTTYNSPTAHGGQGGVGHGGDASSIAGASSVAEAKANAAAIAAQQTNVKNDIKNTAEGGKGGLGVGVGVGGNAKGGKASVGDISIGGDTYERSAPPVVAGNIPSVPTSCRLYLFGGATNTSGAVSGSVPLGNDQTCLSIATVNLMERVGGYTQAEKQAVVCKIEGMGELATCQNLK